MLELRADLRLGDEERVARASEAGLHGDLATERPVEHLVDVPHPPASELTHAGVARRAGDEAPLQQRGGLLRSGGLRRRRQGLDGFARGA